MKTSELLRKAADEIRRRGWWQGFYRELDPVSGQTVGTEADCKVCAWGALNVVIGGPPNAVEEDHDYHSVRVALRYIKRVTGVSTPTFNDTPGRTVEEVLEAFEKAAVAAEADGD